MPRPGPRLLYFGGRIWHREERDLVQALADLETKESPAADKGSLSAMVRKLILEALEARSRVHKT